METKTITQKEFDGLDEYSCSVPTGTTLGKKWKCKRDYHDASKGWFIGEYGKPFDDPRGKRFCQKVPISWAIIEIREQKELKVFSNDVDWFIAHDDEDANEQWAEFSGEDPAEYDHAWDVVADDKVISFYDENLAPSEAVKHTAKEWVGINGRGFLCSTEY